MNQELVEESFLEALKEKLPIYITNRDLLHFKDQFGNMYDQTLMQILKVNLSYFMKKGLDLEEAETELIFFQRVKLYFYRQLLIYPLEEVEKMLCVCEKEIDGIVDPKSRIRFTKGRRLF